MRGNLYIPSIDAKDLYISNNYIDPVPYGYKLTRKDNSDNLRKYINSFDYSLDLIELRKVANEVYAEINEKREKEEQKEQENQGRNKNQQNQQRQPENLSFIINDKEYSV